MSWSWKPPAGDPPTAAQHEPADRRVSPEHPLWSLCKLTLSLAVMSGVLWGGSLLFLRWRGPTLEGTTALARATAERTDDPAVHAVLPKLRAHEIYTFDELKAAAAIIRQANQAAEVSLLLDLLFGLVVGTGALLVLREGIRWAMERGVSASIASPVGVLDEDGTFVPSPLPTPQLSGVTLRRLRRMPWFRELTTLTPLATALLRRYAACPTWPAASEGQHGDTTLLQHVLGVRMRALALAERHDVPPSMAELTALGHDLGKLVTFRRDPGIGDGFSDGWTRASPHHARMSAVLIATLPEWRTLTPKDQEDVTIAIAFHHRPDQIPVTTGLRARALLTLLRQADGLTAAREERALQASPSPSQTAAPPEPGVPQPSAAGPSPAPTTSALGDRVAAALEWLIPVLRINTRPFDGRADPDAGLLMLLDRALRRALAPQLNATDQEILRLDPAAAPPLEEDRRSPEGDRRSTDVATGHSLSNPATEAIAAAFRKLGWLIEQRGAHTGTLWETQIGRLRWHDCWLLRLDVMPQELQQRWGRSEWKIEVVGPTLPTPVQADLPPENTADLVERRTVNDEEGERDIPEGDRRSPGPPDNPEPAALDDGLPGLPGQDLAGGPPDG